MISIDQRTAKPCWKGHHETWSQFGGQMIDVPLVDINVFKP